MLTITDLLIQENTVQERIFNIRDIQVMIDRDLSELYGVETKAVNQAVKELLAKLIGILEKDKKLV
ncbi:ORF6N domain-containing protein [Olivibacter jilunii]|uniref:ORF6N domain-containing protein n=1 Tax=Olivibacter jilunii TaxID=985016 RepID=UPI003F18F4BA